MAAVQPVNPKPFLNSLTGKYVVCELKSGIENRGVLIAVDSYMNLQLAKAEEYIDGNKRGNLGEIIIKSNHVGYVNGVNVVNGVRLSKNLLFKNVPSNYTEFELLTKCQVHGNAKTAKIELNELGVGTGAARVVFQTIKDGEIVKDNMTGMLLANDTKNGLEIEFEFSDFNDDATDAEGEMTEIPQNVIARLKLPIDLPDSSLFQSQVVDATTIPLVAEEWEYEMARDTSANAEAKKTDKKRIPKFEWPEEDRICPMDGCNDKICNTRRMMTHLTSTVGKHGISVDEAEQKIRETLPINYQTLRQQETEGSEKVIKKKK